MQKSGWGRARLPEPRTRVLLIALGTEATTKGYRVRYTLATKLVNELVEAADEKQLNKTIAQYGRVGLFCIDELVYMELGAMAPSSFSKSSPNVRTAPPAAGADTQPGHLGQP